MCKMIGDITAEGIWRITEICNEEWEKTILRPYLQKFWVKMENLSCVSRFCLLKNAVCGAWQHNNTETGVRVYRSKYPPSPSPIWTGKTIFWKATCTLRSQSIVIHSGTYIFYCAKKGSTGTRAHFRSS